MNEVIEKALIALIPSVITFILGYLSNQYRKLKAEVQDKQAERDAMRLAIKYILKKSLMEDYKYFSDLGYLPLEDRQSVSECWKLYHDGFNGNGEGEYCYNKLMALPDKKRGE